MILASLGDVFTQVAAAQAALANDVSALLSIIKDAETALPGKSAAYYASYQSQIQAAVQQLANDAHGIDDTWVRTFLNQAASTATDMQSWLGTLAVARAAATQQSASQYLAADSTAISQALAGLQKRLSQIQAETPSPPPVAVTPAPPPVATTAPPAPAPTTTVPTSGGAALVSTASSLPVPVLIGIIAVAGFLAWRLMR